MKAIISSTYDNNYIYYLPIVRWCWEKLGIDVICFMPYPETELENRKYEMVAHKDNWMFFAPENKKATYAQCARLYGACLDLPIEEVLITSDVDMAVFRLPEMNGKHFTIFGSDLVPDKQYPICYISASVDNWRRTFLIKYGILPENPRGAIMEIVNKTYQEKLDELLGDIEVDHFRGNYWGKDQETAFNEINKYNVNIGFINRARPQTQFATHRIDRDDSYWRERLNHEIIDAHLWRPGYTDEAHKNIMELLQYMYPNDNFEWVDNYRNEYLKLL